MAGKGGGAWKVAYADFVTAMMAFFMVMWLLAQDDKVKDAVAKTFRNETGRYAPGDSLLPPRRDQYFRERLPTPRGESPPSLDDAPKSARRPYTVAINNGNRTAIGTAVVFAPESVELDSKMQRQLTDFSQEVLGKPQKIEIRGHAAEPAKKSEDADLTAWTVSYQRCLSVMKFLVQQGIRPDRIRLSQAGSAEPYARADAPRDDRQARVEVFVLNEVAEDAFGSQIDLERRYQPAGG
jgi:chemotaxis protein MotB